MRFPIRLARLQDANAVHALLVECGLALSADGFDNWNPPAPLEKVQADIEHREVYLVIEDGELIGTVTVATGATVAHDHPLRTDPEANLLYVNRLAVKPGHQGRGLGSWLTRTMEDRARALGCAAVRLDALIANRRIVQFYERAGYERKFERARGQWRFVCLEKPLGEPV